MMIFNALLNLTIIVSMYLSIYMVATYSKGWFAGMFSFIERLFIIIGICLIAYSSIENFIFEFFESKSNSIMNLGLAILTTLITIKIYKFTKRKL